MRAIKRAALGSVRLIAATALAMSAEQASSLLSPTRQAAVDEEWSNQSQRTQPAHALAMRTCAARRGHNTV